MAMYLGRLIFRQAASGFVGGIGTNLRSNASLPGAPRSNNRVSPVARYGSIAMIGFCGYSYYNQRTVAGIPENLRPSTLLAGARRKVCTFLSLLAPFETELYYLGPYYPPAKFLTISIYNISRYIYNGCKETDTAELWEPSAIVEVEQPKLSDILRNRNEEEIKMMEGLGITREHCEARIAVLKPKIVSGSASFNERINLQIVEGWLRVFNYEGEGIGQNALGSSC